MERILLVEDDPNLSMMIIENLEDMGYEAYHLLDGKNVLSLVEHENFDLILMDVDLGGEKDGFEIAEAIRMTNKTLPIIFTTAKKSISDLEKGFNIGNMDYLKKPFGVKELSLRIKSLLNRDNIKKEVFRLGSYMFDPSKQSISVIMSEIKLTKLESSFLAKLCENMGKVVSKEELISFLWEKDDDPQGKESSLHNLAYKLRKIFEEEDSVSIVNISKKGYCLTVKI